MCPADPPGAKDEVRDVLNTLAVLDGAEEGRPVVPHDVRVALHDLERGSDVRCNIDLGSERGDVRRKVTSRLILNAGARAHLVDDEEIRLRDTRSALARDLVSTRDVDLV